MTANDQWLKSQLMCLIPLDAASISQILDYASRLSPDEATQHLQNLLGDSPQVLEFVHGYNAQQFQGTNDRTESTSKIKHSMARSEAPTNAPGRAKTNAKPFDLGLANVKTKTSAPHGAVKVSVQGGVAGHGASTTLEDLDSAIRSLEIQTNSSILSRVDDKARACDCNASRHPLLAAAPNCIRCGKIVCIKEGLGPCTYCKSPLLSPREVQAMIESLRQERGQQRQKAHNQSTRKANVAASAQPFVATSKEPTVDPSKTLSAAIAHRNTLLKYQTQNAQRTTVRDEAADISTPTAGQNIWASPEERARQLQTQQKALREMEWNAKPDYEKRTAVLSIEVGRGGKVVKKTQHKEMPKEEVQTSHQAIDESTQSSSRGAFSRNPLLSGSMIRPTWSGSKGKETVDATDHYYDKDNRQSRATRWRRVQDDNADNETIILDGGTSGLQTLDGVENQHAGSV